MNLSNEFQSLQDEAEYWELVQALLAEQDALEKQIIHLRLNRLHMQLHYARKGHMQTEIPYPEPVSDIVRDFS